MTVKSTKALCVLTVGMEKFLLPADAGMKVATLMQGAKAVRMSYDADEGEYGDYRYDLQEKSVDVEWRSVRAAQVRAPAAPVNATARRTAQPRLPAPEAP